MCLIANSIDRERLVAEVMEDDDDPDFDPREEEVSIA
jgi:hypothetical protein